jgi:hypothetical protein
MTDLFYAGRFEDSSKVIDKYMHLPGPAVSKPVHSLIAEQHRT